MIKQQFISAAKQGVLLLKYARHRLAPLATYAADREDVAAELLVGPVERFIDVGANDGITCSNCFRFAVRGAQGLCFEPDPANFSKLRGLLRFSRRVRCIAEGLSDTDSIVPMRSDGLLSVIATTDDPGLADLLDIHRIKDAPEVRVRVSLLSSWLPRCSGFSCSDLLSIDVEGHELSVLRGIDWNCTPKPARCVVVETHAHGGGKSWVHRDFEEIASLLEAHGYVRICASSNNTFWLHAEDRDDARIARARKELAGYTWEIS